MKRLQHNIVALATPPGSSALAIVRVSGKKLKKLYKQLTNKTPLPRKAVFSKIYNPKTNKALDESVIIYYEGPKSFTGEDMIEIICHGGGFIAKTIISTIIKLGARHADPGEFSLRAFYSGKIDLIQAESINDLIQSNNQISTEIGLNHLSGLASKKIKKIKNKIIKTLIIIENELNFSEEEINITTNKDIKKNLEEIKGDLNRIIKHSLFGKNLCGGIRVVIIGRPNAGKSTLFNLILADERAIVSNVMGTTRDSIEAQVNIKGIPVTLIDTAGLWNTSNKLDSQGVKKTMKEIKRAHVCLLLDENNPNELLTTSFSKKNNTDFILVKTKSDNANLDLRKRGIINISSKNNRGIDKLLTRLSTVLTNNDTLKVGYENIFLNIRQGTLLKEALGFVNKAIKLSDHNVSTDILASTLASFIASLEEIVGEIPNKEIVNEIFTNFCVGK